MSGVEERRNAQRLCDRVNCDGSRSVSDCWCSDAAGPLQLAEPAAPVASEGERDA